MTGKSYKVEEILKHLQAQEMLDDKKIEVMSESTDFIKQSTLVKNEIDKVDVIRDRDIKNQPMSVHGHKISNDALKGPWKHSEHLSDLYDDYLRVYQLDSEQQLVGKPKMKTPIGGIISQMTFEDWIHECLVTQQWRLRDELPKLKKNGKLSKDNFELSKWVASKSIEACNLYLSSTDKQKLILV